jgi:hypothetical protein
VRSRGVLALFGAGVEALVLAGEVELPSQRQPSPSSRISASRPWPGSPLSTTRSPGSATTSSGQPPSAGCQHQPRLPRNPPFHDQPRSQQEAQQ